MKIICGHYSEKGKRSENQDSIMLIRKENFEVFAIADGVGGLQLGREAGQLALNGFQNELIDNDITDIEYLRKLLMFKYKQINEHIYNLAFKNDIRMATTVSMMIFTKDKFILSNVGDTKVYQIRDNNIKTISKLHSIRHVLTMAVGGDREINPYFDIEDIQEGDIYIICSDGVYSFIDEVFMKDYFLNKKVFNEDEMNSLCIDIITHALSNGSNDNLSIIGIKIL